MTPLLQSPVVLGLVYAARTLGPGLGAVLGSLCLRVYAAPGLGGGLAEGEEGWLGAWWLGFVIVAAMTAATAPLLALFPQRLPSQGEATDAKYLGKNLVSLYLLPFLCDIYISTKLLWCVSLFSLFQEKEVINSEKTGREFIEETRQCTKRLFRNKVYMWNLCSAVVALLAFSGMGTFFPKYLEYHFRQTASNTGLSSLGNSVGTGTGILLSGLVISR